MKKAKTTLRDAIPIRRRAPSILFSDALTKQDKRRLSSIDKDLFGLQIVTAADISAWLRAVPRLDPASPRAAAYVTGYDVARKIARAKARGDFWHIINQPRAPRP